MRPREPPATTTWPDVNLVESGPRRGRRSSTRAVISPRAARSPASAGMPMSATRSSPVERLPGATRWPSLAAWKVTVTSALGRGAFDLAGRAVDARGDVGRDDGRAALVHRLDRLLRGRARGAVEAGAEDRVDDAARAIEAAWRPHRARPRERARRGARGSRRRRPRAHPRARAAACRPRSRSRPEAAPRPARRRRCCPCRRRPGPARACATSRTASASAAPAASISWSDGMPRSSIASESAARMLSAS